MIRRPIVFECLAGPHWLIAGWYALRRVPMYYLRTPFRGRPPWWVRRLETKGHLRPLRVKKPVRLRLNRAGERAFEMTEDIYEHLFARRALIRRLEQLFGDHRLELAFKKYLNELLECHVYYQFLGESLRDSLPEVTDFWFVPARRPNGSLPTVTGASLSPWGLPFLEGPALEKKLPPLPMGIPWWSQHYTRFLEFRDNLKVCFETIGLSCWKYVWPDRRRAGGQGAELAILIVAPDREFSNDIRGFDFLLDGTRIRHDNTLWVPLARLQTAQRRRLAKKRLHLAAHPLRPSMRVLGRVVGSMFTILHSMAQAPWWMIRVAAYLVRDYWIWTSFAETYYPRRLLSYNDLSFRHIGRNIILAQHGIETWYYMDTVNASNAHLVEDAERPYRQSIWGYMLYDRCVSWNQQFSHFLSQHQQAIGAYLNLGCLWSEHVRLIREGTLVSTLPEQLVAAGCSLDLKLVAVFDSSYHEDSMGNGIAFALGIEQLLETFPNIFVVWKEKKPRAVMREIQVGALELENLYQRLGRHPRVYFTGYATCASEVIAQCDLVVSFPFTSTTVEALGARTKAIYYDPLNTYRSPYEVRIPGLVVHGFEKLCHRVEELLYQTTREDYGQYLERYVKGELEPYLDGLALTRFREELFRAKSSRVLGDELLETRKAEEALSDEKVRSGRSDP